ncbi:MAG: hypothetical protein ACYTHJ_20890 [Planctomycetota bacterium]
MKRSSDIVTGLAFLVLAGGSARAAELTIIPIRASGEEGVDWVVEPATRTIYLRSNDQQVEVKVYASDFAPQEVSAFQAAISCLSLQSDVQGQALPISTDCTVGGGVFDVDYCLGIDEDEPTYLLANALSTLPACANISQCPNGDPGAYACGAVSIVGDSGPDNGQLYYMIHFGFNLSSDMKGTIEFRTNPDPNQTFLKDPMARDVPILAVNPAFIVVPTGRCCYAVGTPEEGCEDDLTEGECDQQPGFPDWDTSGVTCADGCPPCMFNSDCDDDNLCTEDICSLSQGACFNHITTPEGQCCDPETGGLLTIDDQNPCTADICNADGTVDHIAKDGAPCDDGNACTLIDICQPDGNCMGIPINDITCKVPDDCPAGALGCLDGYCVCTIETEMALEVKPGCAAAGEAVDVQLNKSSGSDCIAGGQFLLTYDPDCLQFEGLANGEEYSTLLFLDVDEEQGTIFAAVSIPLEAECVQQAATLANIQLTRRNDCSFCNLCFDDENPQNTIFVDNTGEVVDLELDCSPNIELSGQITIESPAGQIELYSECDSSGATLTWEPPFATDDCDDELRLDCSARHSSGLDVSHLLETGGFFPPGVATFSCTATNPCGDTASQEWVVQVLDQLEVEVEVQFSPLLASGPIGRCVCFAFYQDCVQEPLEVCTDVSLGNPYDMEGHWSGTINVASGIHTCVTAKDPLHTLRSSSLLDCVDGKLLGAFKGDPALGGNWLINGNLDCWKPDGHGEVIDVLDFGVFVSQYLDTVPPDTECNQDGPHGDINGDGVVDSADFSFIAANFLAASDHLCCDSALENYRTGPVLSITVEALRRMGRAEHSVADINKDGVLNVADMAAFQARDGANYHYLRKVR